MKKNVRGALAYSVGIMSSFVVLGIAVTLIFGATGVQQIATNPFVNLFLAALFVFLALSLFGLFELALPSSVVNRFSSGGKKGGLLGPVLMGVTFSLTTFTCSVPLVGTLLLAATQGDLRYPALGMLAFSSAFALPFFLLALFPQFLAGMPKSGGWLAVVKGFMGFLELAAALKFLSNVDLVYGWGIFPRNVFLGVWAAIMLFAALYLFGIWTFGPAKGVAVGWGRRAFGLLSLVAAGLCINGIRGASMGTFGAFLPPGSDKLTWIENYDQGIAEARRLNRPVFVDFTGVTCTNCRAMEQNVFPLPDVVREMEAMVRIKLYTDRRNEWAANDAANAKLQQKLTDSTALPIYVILSPDGSQKSIFPGSTNDPQEFVSFLRAGRAKASN
jgi:thiol:disulfide interchange protein DsbD